METTSTLKKKATQVLLRPLPPRSSASMLDPSHPSLRLQAEHVQAFVADCPPPQPPVPPAPSPPPLSSTNLPLTHHLTTFLPSTSSSTLYGQTYL